MNKYSITIYNAGKQDLEVEIFAADDEAAVREAIAKTGKKHADIVIVSSPDGTYAMDNVSI